jgi:hypothetical protein
MPGGLDVTCDVHRDGSTRELGRVGPAMMTVLNVLANEGPISTMELLDMVWPGEPYGGHGRTLDRLENVALIRRTLDGRLRQVDITPMGDAAIRRYWGPGQG